MSSVRQNLRIVWAIAAKDMNDALKNKSVLSVILSVLFVLVFYRALPALANLDEMPSVLVYDAGRSSLVTALENSDVVKLHTYPSQQDLERYLANGDVPELGLVIPADFDQVVASGGSPELQGYVLHWVSAADAAKLKRTVEAHISELVGVPVHIQTEEGNVVYSLPNSNGIGIGVGFGVVFVVIMVGISLLPSLMLDEKQAKTLDALLVSPAGPVHVTVAKTLVGLFYCMLGTGVAFAINYALITQWWLAILAVLCGSLFSVSLGLLLGTLIETRQQLALWAWALVGPLCVLTVLHLLSSLLPTLLPAWLTGICQWIPTAALFDVLRVSFSNQGQFELYGPRLGLILAWAAPALGLVAWRIHRSDR